MNKLVLALASVAAFGLSTAAFAETPAAATSAVSTQIQPAQSQDAREPSEVVGRHPLHRRASHARHYGHDRGKKVAVKHLPSKKTVTLKTAS
jgi:hypothetical protein